MRSRGSTLAILAHVLFLILHQFNILDLQAIEVAKPGEPSARLVGAVPTF
jgi:hypothetical protein